MIQDSVTIIVLGNKYNSSIYKSKDIGKIFNGDSFEGDDDGEVINVRTPVTMADLNQLALGIAIKR